jgi:hypothetical protein
MLNFNSKTGSDKIFGLINGLLTERPFAINLGYIKGSVVHQVYTRIYNATPLEFRNESYS